MFSTSNIERCLFKNFTVCNQTRPRFTFPSLLPVPPYLCKAATSLIMNSFKSLLDHEFLIRPGQAVTSSGTVSTCSSPHASFVSHPLPAIQHLSRVFILARIICRQGCQAGTSRLAGRCRGLVIAGSDLWRPAAFRPSCLHTA